MADAATAEGITLVLGGARSGKSRYAERLVQALPPPWIYVATAQAGDIEMAERIATHRARRPEGWRTVDAPHDLGLLLAAAPPKASLLVDCMTLWLSNRMLAQANMECEIPALVGALKRCRNPLVLVSNEVGSGIVPENALARRFRDLQGQLNQSLAACADRVVLVVAGIPLIVKGCKPKGAP